MRFYCKFCNEYEYDEAEGDPATGIRPGQRPADLPKSWRCPVCGVGPEYMVERVEVT